jgi:hypothetical protein
MHAILSTLVAATLLAHVLLGCCWHHAHGCVICESEKPDAASPEEAPTATCCRHDAHQDKYNQDGHDLDQHAGHEQPRQGPCKCQIDVAAQCSAHSSGIGRSRVCLRPPRGFPVALATGQSVEAVRGRSCPAQTEPLPRLHLMHQIPLI